MKQKIIKKPKITLELLFNMLQNIPTREEVVEIVRRELQNHPTRNQVELMFQKINYELDEKLMQLKSDFFDKIDSVIGEIEDNREHREISTKDTREIKKILENHEKRIKQFEQH